MDPADQTRKKPWALEIRSSTWLVCTTVSVASFTDILLYTIIVPVAPFILTERAGVEHDQVQYYTSLLLAVYGLCLALFAPVCGYIADHTATRRAPFTLGLLMLGGATALLMLSKTIGLLILARVLQGLSGAVVGTAGLATLVDASNGGDVGRLMAFTGMASEAATLLGPPMGGFIFHHAGYTAVFVTCFAFIAVDGLLRLVMIEKRERARWIKDEVEVEAEAEAEAAERTALLADGQALATASASASSSSSDSDHWLARLIHSLKTSALYNLVSSGRMLMALFGLLVQCAIVTSFDAVLPLFVQRVFGWSSLGAGLIFTPLVVPALLSPVAGWIGDRYGARWPVAIAFVLVAPLYILLRLVDHDSTEQKVLLVALLLLIGFTIVLVNYPLMAEISYATEARELERPGVFGKQGAHAQAYSLFIAAFAAGSFAGPLMSGLVQSAAGWKGMTLSFGLVCIVAGVVSALGVGGWIGNDKLWKKIR